MYNNFHGQKYIFPDNKLPQKTHNFYQNHNFSKTYYKPKDEKESSNFVLQKMQLSLNNFLSNLKKNENVENLDIYPMQYDHRTLDNERSFNIVNPMSNQNNNAFKHYQDNVDGFPRGKEMSETNIINKNNKNSNKYYKSPYLKDENLRDNSNFNNSMYSFYTSHNNQLNNIHNNISNNYITGMPRANTENDNNITLPVRINRNKNSNILINENSSYSSEENRNNNINDNNNNNNDNIAKNDPIHIVNNFDNSNDYKKLVEKIKEKKSQQNKEKDKINNVYNINNLNVDNINNLNDDISLLNEKKLQSIHNEILLNSNNKKKNKRDIKENKLSFSKKYIDNSEELYSNSTILNRKNNYFIDNNIVKKEYSKEKDNEYRKNYRRLKRSNEGIMIPIEGNDYNIINKEKKNESYSKDINNEKLRYKNDMNQEDIKELIQRRINDINIYENKENIKNDFKKDYLSKEQIQNFVINAPKEIYGIYQSNLDKKKDNYKILPGMSFGIISPGKHLNKNNNNENISINNNKNYNIKNNNDNSNDNKYNKNMSVTKNNFEIIDKNVNYKDEKDKILEKLLFENNALKEKIINKENEIQQLNIDKSMYKDFDISKYQQIIKELDSKIKDNKNIKGQLNILKSQKSNLYKDYYKYKDISETLKKENEKLLKEKDEYKKQRDKLNNEIKILKLNTNRNNNISNSKTNISKTTSKSKLLTENNSNTINNKIKKNKKKNIDKKCHTLENESITNSVSKDPSVMTNNTNNNYKAINIVKNDNFSFLGSSNYNINNNSKNDNDKNIMNNININNSRNILLEKIISNKDKEISNFKEQIKALNNELKDFKELKDNKEVKRRERSKSKKIKTDNNDNNNSKIYNEEKNNKKYVDEINELKNNIKKLENEKTSLKKKIENIENKKNNNEQLQKQIEDLKKQINYSNNQIKSLRSKNAELDEFFSTTKSFIKIIKPSNEKETNLYYKLKNHIDFLEKEKMQNNK